MPPSICHFKVSGNRTWTVLLSLLVVLRYIKSLYKGSSRSFCFLSHKTTITNVVISVVHLFTMLYPQIFNDHSEPTLRPLLAAVQLRLKDVNEAIADMIKDNHDVKRIDMPMKADMVASMNIHLKAFEDATETQAHLQSYSMKKEADNYARVLKGIYYQANRAINRQTGASENPGRVALALLCTWFTPQQLKGLYFSDFEAARFQGAWMMRYSKILGPVVNEACRAFYSSLLYEVVTNYEPRAPEVAAEPRRWSNRFRRHH